MKSMKSLQLLLLVVGLAGCVTKPYVPIDGAEKSGGHILIMFSRPLLDQGGIITSVTQHEKKIASSNMGPNTYFLCPVSDGEFGMTIKYASDAVWLRDGGKLTVKGNVKPGEVYVVLVRFQMLKNREYIFTKHEVVVNGEKSKEIIDDYRARAKVNVADYFTIPPEWGKIRLLTKSLP